MKSHISNYDKQPYIKVDGCGPAHSFVGCQKINRCIRERIDALGQDTFTLVIDCYPGVDREAVEEFIIRPLNPVCCVYADEEIFESDTVISSRIRDQMTDDRVFGVMTHYQFRDFIVPEKLAEAQEQIRRTAGLRVVYGVGASLVCRGDVLILADLARWEIQQRYRNGMANWKDDSPADDALKKFKRGYFFEWRIADRHKKTVLNEMDYFLDTNLRDRPKMVTAESYLAGLKKTASTPFRVVPFFDPGVWGGQWMKDVCDLDRSVDNYAWAFDCVPEENSLLLEIGGAIIETPSINLVFQHPEELLGGKVYSRFGAEFPIRFDILDTMGGQNLSLQVHPSTEYIYENFGIPYTQDESYYILDAKEDAIVYLGLKEGTDREQMIADLLAAQHGGHDFPAERYINQFPAARHDHFLIPSGTIHCSGKNALVLEISATPYIFTFKLWDWGRTGLDGRPRPVHIEYGKQVIDYGRDTGWVKRHLVNQTVTIDESAGMREERTGLHELEFIETRRHWFSTAVTHYTEGSVNVLNLVAGQECIVESPVHTFEPFIVHYAETFIIPAAVECYTIRPYGESEGQEIATLKAYVRL